MTSARKKGTRSTLCRSDTNSLTPRPIAAKATASKLSQMSNRDSFNFDFEAPQFHDFTTQPVETAADVWFRTRHLTKKPAADRPAKKARLSLTRRKTLRWRTSLLMQVLGSRVLSHQKLFWLRKHQASSQTPAARTKASRNNRHPPQKRPKVPRRNHKETQYSVKTRPNDPVALQIPSTGNRKDKSRSKVTVRPANYPNLQIPICHARQVQNETKGKSGLTSRKVPFHVSPS